MNRRGRAPVAGGLYQAPKPNASTNRCVASGVHPAVAARSWPAYHSADLSRTCPRGPGFKETSDEENLVGGRGGAVAGVGRRAVSCARAVGGFDQGPREDLQQLPVRVERHLPQGEQLGSEARYLPAART